MNISKLGALWALMTGGWSGLVVYLLEAVNEALAKLDAAKLAEVAKIVKSVMDALHILGDTFVPERYRTACRFTVEALADLAVALQDGKLTKDELDAEIDAVEAAVEEWKKAK